MGLFCRVEARSFIENAHLQWYFLNEFSKILLVFHSTSPEQNFAEYDLTIMVATVRLKNELQKFFSNLIF